MITKGKLESDLSLREKMTVLSPPVFEPIAMQRPERQVLHHLLAHPLFDFSQTLQCYTSCEGPLKKMPSLALPFPDPKN